MKTQQAPAFVQSARVEPTQLACKRVDVYFNTAICQHSGNCVRGNGKLFNLKRKPWIMPDEVDVATVVKVIDTCPSGALKYRHK